MMGYGMEYGQAAPAQGQYNEAQGQYSMAQSGQVRGYIISLIIPPHLSKAYVKNTETMCVFLL